MEAALLGGASRRHRRDATCTLHVGALLRYGKWCFAAVLLCTLVYRQLLHQPLPSHDENLGDIAHFQVHSQHPERLLADTAATTATSHDPVTSGCSDHHYFEVIPSSLDAMLSMLLTGLVLCLFLEHCNMRVCVCIRLPISCVIFLAGMLCEELFKVWYEDVNPPKTHVEDFLGGRLSVSQIDPHAIFYILLPPLLYESASSMPWHVIRRVLGSAVVLAGPGVVVNVLITGLVSKNLVHDAAGENFDWSTSFMLASILSATDPVAVVAALRSLGAPKKLSTLIEGESLLNDGSAFVLFSVFKDIVAKTDSEDADDIVNLFLWKFSCLAGFGIFIGLVAGLIVLAWIRRARFLHFPVLELAIILCAVYGSFFFSEQVGGSGVLTVVTFGLMMTANINPLLSHHARHAHHLTIDEIGYLSDRMIFFIGGVVSMRFLRITDSCDVSFTKMGLELILLYIILHITRSSVVACFGPLLQRSGYGLNVKEGAILVYGGLRGAVGLAMGLMVEHNSKIHPNVGTVVAFHTSGIVLLTILVNGSTVEYLYRKLRPYPDPVARVRLVMKALKKVEEKCQCHKNYGLNEMRDHWFFHDICFEQVYSCIPNFRTLDFDSTYRPTASGIHSVPECLNNLEQRARLTHRMGTLESGIANNSFTDAWRNRRAEVALEIHEWLPSAEELREASDIMVNVMDNGGHSMGYNPPETTQTLPEQASRPSGLFCSRRSLAVVCLESSLPRKRRRSETFDEPMSPTGSPVVSTPVSHQRATFTLKIKKLGCQIPWVGVVCSPSALSSWKGEEAILGHMDNTVGFSCQTGEIRYNLTGQTVSIAALLTPKVGNVLHICVDTDEDTNMWQISFALAASGHGQVAVGTVTLGKYTPSDLYPTVELRVQTGDDADLPNKPPSTSSQSVQHNQSSGTNGSRRMSTTLVLAGENILRQMTTVTPTVSVADSRVALSFEPQIPNDAEDLDEIFTVFLNTVTRKYRKLNERGCVDEYALSWLLEAAGEAADCAHNEVHARHIMSFFNDPQEGNLALLKEKLTDVDGKGRYVFEPVLVEYLALFNSVAKVSFFDRYPTTWKFAPVIRSFGYFRTRTKVGCLFAFVECHIEAMREHEILGRFPGLLHCLNSVLSAAKRDLALVEDYASRRFFFSKHYLVIKLDMSQRVRALEEARDEGWISPGDVEHLMEDLHERLAYVETYFPSRIQVGMRGRRRHHLLPACLVALMGSHLSDDEEDECAPAWSKVFSEGGRKGSSRQITRSASDGG